MSQKFPDCIILTTKLGQMILPEQFCRPYFAELRGFLSDLYHAIKFPESRPVTTLKEGNELSDLLSQDCPYAEYLYQAFSAADEVRMCIAADTSNTAILATQISFYNNNRRIDALLVFNFNPTTGKLGIGHLGGNEVIF